ncbi:MAG TPA: 2-phosphosulfolactate phosphatase [Thermoanaerobaculia bacterium]
MRVTCDWGVNALANVPRDSVVIVVDVFSFSTAVTVACGRGARIYPCPWSDDRAAELARTHEARLASKTRDTAFSLSPSALREIPHGTRMVLPSRNGSAIAFAARQVGIETIAVGCLRNASAVTRWIGERSAAIIACGERWADDSLRFAIEDWLAAGAIISRMPHARSAEAEAAAAAFERLCGQLADALRGSLSGRELVDAGWPDDVDVASELDADDLVPILDGNAFRATR